MLAGAMLAACPSAARALSFRFTTISGDTLTTDQRAAFQAAADAWSAIFSDAITVNITIGFRALGASTLGASSVGSTTQSQLDVHAHLALDAKGADDNQAVATFPSGFDNVILSTAQARALGYTTSGSDGSIEFSSDVKFATARSADGTVPSDSYDLIGVAEHEIGHVLGFFSTIDYGQTALSVLDAFRYASSGTRSHTAGQSAYFSLDGGATRIADFSVGGTNQYQASHWLLGTGGLMDPAVSTGHVQNITALDVQALDVLGYDRIAAAPAATTVPEPASLLLLTLGGAGAALVRRRRAA